MSLALRPAWVLAAKKTLTGAGATVRCQSIYIVAPAQVGQPDRGRDELTKAGNARGITEQRLPDDAGDPQGDAGRHIFSSSISSLSVLLVIA